MKKKVFALMLICLAALMLGIGCTGSPDISVPDPYAPEVRIAEGFSVTPHSGLMFDIANYDRDCDYRIYLDGNMVTYDDGEPVNIWPDDKVYIDEMSFGKHTVVIETVDWNTGKTHRSAPITFTVGEGISYETYTYGKTAKNAIEYFVDLNDDNPHKDSAGLRIEWSIKALGAEKFKKVELEEGCIIPVTATDGYPFYELRAEVFDGEEKLFERTENERIYGIRKGMNDKKFLLDDNESTFSCEFSFESPYIDLEKNDVEWVLNGKIVAEKTYSVTLAGGLEYSGSNYVNLIISNEYMKDEDHYGMSYRFSVAEKNPGTITILSSNGKYEISVLRMNKKYTNRTVKIGGYDSAHEYVLLIDGIEYPIDVKSDGKFMVNCSELDYGRHSMRVDDRTGNAKGKTYSMIVEDFVDIAASPMKDRTIPIDAELVVETPDDYAGAQYTWNIWIDSDRMWNDASPDKTVITDNGHLDFTLDDGEQLDGILGVSVLIESKTTELDNMTEISVFPEVEMKCSDTAVKGSVATFEFVDKYGVLDPETIIYKWYIDGNEMECTGSTLEHVMDYQDSTAYVECVITPKKYDDWEIIYCWKNVILTEKTAEYAYFTAEFENPEPARGEALRVNVTDGLELTGKGEGIGYEFYLSSQGEVYEGYIDEGGIEFRLPEFMEWGTKNAVVRVIEHTWKDGVDSTKVYSSNLLHFTPRSSVRIVQDESSLPELKFHLENDFEPGKNFNLSSLTCHVSVNGGEAELVEGNTYSMTLPGENYDSIYELVLNTSSSELAETSCWVWLSDYFRIDGPEEVGVGKEVTYQVKADPFFNIDDFSFDWNWGNGNSKEYKVSFSEKGEQYIGVDIFRNSEYFGSVVRYIEVK